MKLTNHEIKQMKNRFGGLAVALAIALTTFVIGTAVKTISNSRQNTAETLAIETTSTTTTLAESIPETTVEETTEVSSTESTTEKAETTTEVTTTIVEPITIIEDIRTANYNNVPLDPELQGYIEVQCAKYDINPRLVFAIIEVESGYQANAVSNGNYGLMQINQVNFKAYHLDEPLNPYENVRVGIEILATLYKSYHNTQKVLMAYNMGEGAAAKLWAQGVYDTNYTIKVNRALIRLEEGK